MDATSHARAAKSHAEDAAQQINQVVHMLQETLSYLAGTNQDSVSLAAGHLHEIHTIVGSTTAGELSARYATIANEIRDVPHVGIVNAIEHLKPIIDHLVRLGNDTEQLAAVLGA